MSHTYVVLVTADRIVLAELCGSSDGAADVAGSGSNSDSMSGSGGKQLNAMIVWSCPASCIVQLFHDARGDLCLALSTDTPVSLAGVGSYSFTHAPVDGGRDGGLSASRSIMSSTVGTGALSLSSTATALWNSPTTPTVMDPLLQDYIIFQCLLESLLGLTLARLHPLLPSGGYIQANILKKYSTGIKSIMSSPSKHVFRLFGNILYEYTRRKHSHSHSHSHSSSSSSRHIRTKGIAVVSPGMDTSDNQTDGEGLGREENRAGVSEERDTEATQLSNSEEYINRLVEEQFRGNRGRDKDRDRDMKKGKGKDSFPTATKVDTASNDDVVEEGEELVQDHYLSFVYPLCRMGMTGPVPEKDSSDGSKVRHCRIARTVPIVPDRYSFIMSGRCDTHSLPHPSTHSLSIHFYIHIHFIFSSIHPFILSPIHPYSLYSLSSCISSIHSSLYSFFFGLCTPHILYTIYYILYTIYYILYTIHLRCSL